MTDTDDRYDDSLVGQEIVSVTLTRFRIEVRLAAATLQLWADFVLHWNGALHRYSPERNEGNLEALWRLIGRQVTGIDLGPIGEIEIGDARIVFERTAGARRGEILETGPNDEYLIEEF